MFLAPKCKKKKKKAKRHKETFGDNEYVQYLDCGDCMYHRYMHMHIFRLI